jgi:hypothetical protein
MNKDIALTSVETIQTTIGELVELITEIALENGQSEEEGFELASMTIESILRRVRNVSDLQIN